MLENVPAHVILNLSRPVTLSAAKSPQFPLRVDSAEDLQVNAFHNCRFFVVPMECIGTPQNDRLRDCS